LCFRNTADQVLNSLSENVAGIRKYLSVGALKLMAEKNPDQVAKRKLFVIDFEQICPICVLKDM